jgi:transposase
MKPEQAEIDRLRKEVAKLKVERDILKKLSRAVARLCAVETGRVILHSGGELPMAFWRHSTPLKNVAQGLMRTCEWRHRFCGDLG